MNKEKVVFDFLNSQLHMIVASVTSDGKPQAATVGFGQTKDLEIIFGTDKTTRKAKNILQKPSVALTFNGPHSTLQYEGEARLITDSEKEKYAMIYIEKVPDASKFYNLKNQIYFLVSPKWLRYTDHTTTPGTVFELDFS